MKAKKLMGVIACAGACVSLSSFANTTNAWFAASASGSTPSLNNVAVSGDYTVADSKFTIDNSIDNRLVFTPDASFASTNMSDGVVSITATAVLTPSDESDLTTEGLTSAKAGLAVGVSNSGADTNFYGFAGAANAQSWTKLTGTPPSDGLATTFTIILDYRTHKVQFLVDGAVLSAATGGATSFDFADGTDSLVSIDAFGSGSISTINSGYEVAVVAYNSNKYGSVADAITAGGDASSIHDVTSSGEIATGTAAACGLPVAVCKALGIDTTAENPATIKVLPVVSDGDASNITLAMDANQSVETGLAVKFAVKKNGSQVGELCDSNAIKIPLSSGTGVYTVEPADVGVAQ